MQKNTINPQGFLRLKQILEFIPVSKGTWWNGVRSGRFPKSIKNGSCTFWRGSDIIELLEKMGNGGEI
jgi:predicted DNA-binding transcriptional regulator AlpA